jgi:hypothetical protein
LQLSLGTDHPVTEQRHKHEDAKPKDSEDTRAGGGGRPVPADDPLDESLEGEDAGTKAENATPPTEGPAAAGALPG